MTIASDLTKPLTEYLGKKIAKQFLPDDSPLILKKIFRVFQAHRIQFTQIPLIAPPEYNLTLKDISDAESLSQKVDARFLEWISNLFNINPDWFHVDDAKVYDEKYVYKSSINDFVDILIEKQKAESFTELIVVKVSGDLFPNSRVKLLLLEHHEDNNVEYWTHTVMRPAFSWGHTGDQVIIMVRMFYSIPGLGHIQGMSISERQMDLLEEGYKFIGSIKFAQKGHWTPDAYSMFNEESHIACNGDNLQEIINWGYRKNLIQYFEEKTGLSLKNSGKLGGINSVLNRS